MKYGNDMVLNFIFDILTLLILIYLVAYIHVDTTEFEYKIACGVNKVYNWFKKIFSNGE